MRLATRYGVPGLIFLAGGVLLVIGSDAATGAGIVLMGVALLVLLFNGFARLSESSQTDRDREEAARAYFDRHGHWPSSR